LQKEIGGSYYNNNSQRIVRTEAAYGDVYGGTGSLG